MDELVSKNIASAWGAITIIDKYRALTVRICTDEDGKPTQGDLEQYSYLWKLLQGADPILLRKFRVYHKNNPHIYEQFKELSLAMFRSGRQHYSAWCVINKIRWDYDLKVQGKDKFKISNGYIAFFARMLIAEHPEIDGFFQLKKLGGNHDTK